MILMVKVAKADEVAPPLPVEAFQPAIYLDLGAGIDLLNGFTKDMLGGTQVNVEWSFDKNFSTRLEFAAPNYESDSYQRNDLRFLPELKYFWGGGKSPEGTLTPYLIGGAGLDVSILSFYNPDFSLSFSYFDAVLGIGTEFNFEDVFALYLEAKTNFIFQNGPVTADFPVLAGLHIHL